MVYRITAACCLTLLVTGTSLAQTTPPTATKTPEQLTRDVLDLQQKLAATAENLTKLAQQVAKNTENSEKNVAAIDRLTTIINDELHKQQVILDALTQKDAAGNDMLRLSANMEKSEEFRDDVRKAVHQALETHGEFSIHNRMGTLQRIVVNQKEYSLNADEILTLKVPVGTVTARLPGQALTNWTVAAPQYSQKVEIIPDANAITTTVYRPGMGEPALPSSTLPAGPVYLTPLPRPVHVGPVREYYVWPY